MNNAMITTVWNITWIFIFKILSVFSFLDRLYGWVASLFDHLVVIFEICLFKTFESFAISDKLMISETLGVVSRYSYQFLRKLITEIEYFFPVLFHQNVIFNLIRTQGNILLQELVLHNRCNTFFSEKWTNNEKLKHSIKKNWTNHYSE